MGNRVSRRRVPTQGIDEFGYRDIQQEHVRAPVAVAGSLPPWLHGTLYRQAGGAFIAGGSKAGRLLDGLAHVVAWHIAGGTASFSNRFLDTSSYRHWKKTGERAWGGTGNASIVEPEQGAAKTAHNLNVNFWWLPQGVAASSEFPGGPVVLLDEDLGSVREVAAASGDIRAPGGMNFFSAHYQVGEVGDLHASVYLAMDWPSYFKPPSFRAGYRLFRSPGHALPLEMLAEIPITEFSYFDRGSQALDKRVSYIHTTAETEHFFVIVVSSKRLLYEKILARDFSEGFFGLFRFESGAPVKFLVLDKQGALVKEVTAEKPGMCYHLVNSFEEGGRLLVDLSWQSADVFRDRGAEQGLRRYELDLQTGQASERPVSARITEFACVNPAVLGKRHRFVYGLDTTAAKFQLYKEDVETGVVTAWPLSAASSASEPQFAPRPGGVGEDDGVLLVPTACGEDGTSFLLVLDASSMQELARLPAPVDVNDGLHNLFVGGDASAGPPTTLSKL